MLKHDRLLSTYLSINDKTNFIFLAKQFTKLRNVTLECLSCGLAHQTIHHTFTQT